MMMVFDGCNVLDVDGFEYMQFTGLKDKNNKEIYEGDIIDFGGLKPIEIIWKDAGFQSKMYGGPVIKLTEEGMSYFAEVIGNIYENPDLVNDKLQ